MFCNIAIIVSFAKFNMKASTLINLIYTPSLITLCFVFDEKMTCSENVITNNKTKFKIRIDEITSK